MTNLEKYENAFTEYLSVDRSALPTLGYQSIPIWDSVGHMGLMALLEETFGIMLDTEDVIDFSSFEKGKTILRKYGVEL